MKQAQISYVKQQLKINGCITRNQCLRVYISRLSAIIAVLKSQGYDFTTEYISAVTPWGKSKDYKYNLVKE
jgi:hypothetical protein